jgi:hypothetical protein
MLVILGNHVPGRRVRILAILLAMAGSSLPGCQRDGHGERDRGERDRGEREVDALQQQVRRLSTQLSTLKIVVEGLTQPAPPLAPDQQFVIDCPASWEQVEPASPTRWACRTVRPLADGFWPNCNLTSGPAEASASAKQYFENALTGTELSTVRVRSGREVSLNGNPAYEVVYEHDLAQQPLQVLAAIVIRRADAYALTCSSTPAAFAELEPRFRAILASFDFGR